MFHHSLACSLKRENDKIKKLPREYQASRRSLVEELGAEKDRALAQSQRMAVLGGENEELRVQLKSMKDKFEILAEEIQAARVQNEIRALAVK